MAPVRGRAACDGCRSRKQKCDEKRPTCSRCRDMKRECVWPKLYKRGPAKGYIEALEHRLAVTEAVLLQLLEVSDDAVLQDAFKHEPSKRADVLHMAATAAAATTTDAAGRIEAKKTGTIAHWDNFPLNTADEVKRWAGEVLGRRTDNSNNSSSSSSSMAMNGTAQDEADQDLSFKTYPVVPPAPLSKTLSSEVSPRTAGVPVFPPQPLLEASPTALPTAVEPSTTFTRDMTTGEVFDLSQDFRRQFVW